MTYSQAIDYLYAIAPPFHQVGAAAYKPGLDTMRRLMAAITHSPAHPLAHSPAHPLTHSPFNIPVVHVAGTNGKGSTAHLIASCLAAADYKVGLYTSPHLVSFCERVRVIENKTPRLISEDYVAGFVEQHQALFAELQPSFFEITTAMAFCWLTEQQVDVAVIEVGLGGLLDSTNIVNPVLSVITNIGYDHTDLLGHTLAEIATQKAGIIKPGVPCVIGETNEQTEPVFLARARECNILGDGLETTDCRIWFADQCGFLRRQRLRFAPDCQLRGDYQQQNLQTAYVAVQVLRNYCAMDISASAIRDGFANVVTYTGLRGRWETLSEYPLTICDTGHNSHGISTYVQQLKDITHHTSYIKHHKSYITHLHIVFAMVADKDVDAVLRLMPADATYYFTQPDSRRALPAEEMLAKWRNLHSQTDAQAFSRIDDALRAAQQAAEPEDVIFIGGSNYVVGAAIRIIESAKLG